MTTSIGRSNARPRRRGRSPRPGTVSRSWRTSRCSTLPAGLAGIGESCRPRASWRSHNRRPLRCRVRRPQLGKRRPSVVTHSAGPGERASLQKRRRGRGRTGCSRSSPAIREPIPDPRCEVGEQTAKGIDDQDRTGRSSPGFCASSSTRPSSCDVCNRSFPQSISLDLVRPAISPSNRPWFDSQAHHRVRPAVADYAASMLQRGSGDCRRGSRSNRLVTVHRSGTSVSVTACRPVSIRAVQPMFHRLSGVAKCRPVSGTTSATEPHRRRTGRRSGPLSTRALPFNAVCRH